VGVTKHLLTITNKDGGVYEYLLIGQSSQPLPKGPYKIGPKGQSIEFKNPFYQPTEFKFTLENPSFTVNQKGTIKLEAKKSLNLAVSYKSV
jgi:hypothetical protein